MAIDFDILHSMFDSEGYKTDESARRLKLEGFWKFYNGDHKHFLKTPIDGVDDNVTINFCGVLVDRAVSRLFGDSVRGDLIKMDVRDREEKKLDTAKLDEGEEPTKSKDSREVEARAFLNSVFERSGGLQKIYNRLGVYGAVGGHYFLKLMVEDLGPRVIILDPMITSILISPDDKDRVLAYKVEYETMRKDARNRVVEATFRQITAHDVETDGWEVADFIRMNHRIDDAPDANKTLEDTTSTPKWVQEGKTDLWDVCPIMDGQNLPNANDIYGKSDMDNVTGLNDEINFLMSNVNKIVRFQGHPRTVGIGVDASGIQETAIENFWSVPGATPDEAEIFNLEMKSDLAAIFGFFQIIREAFWTIGREADPATFKEKIGNVTNFGLRVLFLDALNKLGQKRQSYGPALIRLSESLFALGDFGNMTVDILWGDPLPSDPREAVETLTIEHTLGIVSKETAAQERGRNWLEEEQRIKKEQRDEESVTAKFVRNMQRGDPTNMPQNMRGQNARLPKNTTPPSDV